MLRYLLEYSGLALSRPSRISVTIGRLPKVVSYFLDSYVVNSRRDVKTSGEVK